MWGTREDIAGLTGDTRLRRKHHLGSLRRSRVSPVSPAISSRVPHIHPVRRPVHRPATALRIDKGFQQHHAVPESFFPIPGQTPLTERENARPQVEEVPVRYNQEPAALDSQLQAAAALAQGPTNPAIAHGALQSR